MSSQRRLAKGKVSTAASGEGERVASTKESEEEETLSLAGVVRKRKSTGEGSLPGMGRKRTLGRFRERTA